MSWLNVRYQGTSFEFDMDELDIGIESSDDDIIRAVAESVELQGGGDRLAIYNKISDFVVDKNQETGDITVRASAVFGANNNEESDTRTNILQTLLKCPHRDISSLMPVHKEIQEKDPLFYRSLAAWYWDTGEVRDNQDCFIINLCLSTFDGNRDVGLALFRKLPPHRASKIVDFIQKSGNIPRSLKTEVLRYLREREADKNWFDTSVMRAKAHLKKLYKMTKTPPSERAQEIVFENNVPEDSVLNSVKKIKLAKTPSEQASIIIENNIPFPIACSVIKAMTPTVLLALANNMSDQEIINSIGLFKKHGAFNNKELKEFINNRIKSAKKISTLKGDIASSSVEGLDDDIKSSLDNKVTQKVKAKAKIKKTTAILIDKSGSMQRGIEVGKRIAAMVSTACTGEVYVYAYDRAAYSLTDKKSITLNDWDKKYSGIKAGGGTLCASALMHMCKKNINVEQIIIVTDQGDSSVSQFKRYMSQLQNSSPMLEVVIVNVDSGWGRIDNRMFDALSKAEIPCQLWNYDKNDSDYYSLPELLPLIAGGGMSELLTDILSWELPKRKTC